jgi:hypothetical protein
MVPLSRSSFPLHSKEWSVDGERFTDQTMKRSTLQRLAIALAIIAIILIQAYLETTAGFTPNH